jgi:phage-related protein
VKRRWRFYRTPAGRRVIDEFLDALPLFDASEVAAAMKEVRDKGLTAARHLRGDIYEVRADGRDDSYRLLFATEGRKSRILLGLHVMPKHAQKTPNQDLRKAERRLIEWRQRGKALRPRP